MSAQTVPAMKIYTAEDLAATSARGSRYELIRGGLREMSPIGGVHGSVTDRLAAYMRVHVDEHELGECFAAETGFLIASEPDTVLAPDYAYIAANRLPAPLPEKYVPVVPDLVIETRSPNDTSREVASKVERWLQAGVRLVWEIDPRARLLTVHRSDREPASLSDVDVLTAEDVLPGFTYALHRLFRES